MKPVLLLDHVLVSGSRFLLSVLVARLLGLEDFGTYALIWTIVTLASSLQIPIAITPLMQLGPRVTAHREASFFTTCLWIQLGFSLAAIPFVAAVSLFMIGSRPDSLGIVVAINLYILAFNQYEFIRRYFFTKGKWRHALVFDGLLYGLLLAMVLGFLTFGGVGIATYLALSALPTAFFCFWTLRTYPFRKDRRAIHLAQLRRAQRIAAPLLVSTLAGFVSGHTFIYAVAAVLGAADVGGIAAARNMMGPLVILMMALENGITREAVQLHKTSPGRLGEFILRAGQRWFAVFLAYVVAISFFAQPVLDWIYGADFGAYYTLIYWLGAASLMQIITRVQSIKLRAKDEYRTIKAANLAAMWLSLTVSIPLVIWLGLTGAMLAVLAQQGAILLFQTIPLRLDVRLGLMPCGFRQPKGA